MSSPSSRGESVISQVDVRTIIVIGVAGSGKTTIGHVLAARLDFTFIDADSLHTSTNLAKMASGQPLNDADRWPWLDAVSARIVQEEETTRGTVTACSALKHSYRDRLRTAVPDAFFVQLEGPKGLIRRRVEDRGISILPISLLDSQFDTLEPLGSAERGTRVDVASTPEAIVDNIVAALNVKR